MIVGAQKSATSSLAAGLAQHPRVCFSSEKEPHFFSKCEAWKESIHQYHELFLAKPGQLCGEASTSYTFFPEVLGVPGRLYEYNSDLKFIYVIRDPIERIRSHYAHRIIMDRVKAPIDIEVLSNPIYVNRSRYAVQIREYLNYFDKASILIVKFDDFVRNDCHTWKRITSHLSLEWPDDDQLAVGSKNVTTDRRVLRRFWGRRLVRALSRRAPALEGILPDILFRSVDEKPVMRDDTKRALWAMLRDDVHEIDELFDVDLSRWRRKHGN